jgi:hypothetical protein
MKKPTEFTFTDTVAGAGVRPSAERRTAKSARTSKQLASAAKGKRRSRATRKLRRASSIRETEEARALLEKQLHSLYWWVFNACKMKGFIRAKGLSEPADRRLNASGDARSSSPEKSLNLPKTAGGN